MFAQCSWQQQQYVASYKVHYPVIVYEITFAHFQFSVVRRTTYYITSDIIGLLLSPMADHCAFIMKW